MLGRRQRDRFVAAPVEAEEAIGLQPGEIAADRLHIAVAIAVAAMHLPPAGQVGGGALGQIALRRRVADLEQRRGGAGIVEVEVGVAAEQADQKQQALQIEQP